MDNKFGMQVPLNPPEIDFDAGTIAYKLSVCSVENLDNAIFSEICKIAREKGVTTLVALDKQKVVDALHKATPKKVKLSNYLPFNDCPSCNTGLMMPVKYCHECGQKLDWEN